MSTAYVIATTDNVATLLSDSSSAEVRLLGAGEGSAPVHCAQPIPRGQKMALANIPKGADIIKFGASIGTATADIPKGTLVHLHNMASNYTVEENGEQPITSFEYKVY